MDPASYRISEKAVERVAQVAVSSVPGTADIDAKLAGLAGRSFPRVDAHIDRAAGSVTLEVEIVTTYPAPVGAITDEVRQTVGTHVETLTGLKVTRVNIAVADAEASAPGMRVTRNDLALHPVGVTPKPIHVAASSVSSPVVAEPVALAPVVTFGDTYDHLAPIHVAPLPRIKHVSAPPAARARGVEAPPQRPLTRITVAEPAPVVQPTRPAPQPLRAVDIEPSAEQRVISMTTPLPRKPVVVPPLEPLREITVRSFRELEPVSLPARAPLEPIYAARPKHIEVVRPTPEPLRAVGVASRNDVLVPQVPAQRPLDPITIDPENAVDVDARDQLVTGQALQQAKEAR